VRNCKLDLVTRTKDAAVTAVGLGELNESSSLRCRIHLQFHEGQHTVGGSGTKSRTKTTNRLLLRQQARPLTRKAPWLSDAGAEGLEPPAYGFGDRRSTN
jgi:hypothetical protein